MKLEKLLRAMLPSVIIDNFDITNFEKTETRFDIWLDEKKVQMREDKKNPDVISYGFDEYHNIHDYPIRGRSTWLHARKRKWLDKSTGEIFSYTRPCRRIHPLSRYPNLYTHLQIRSLRG